MNAGWNHFNFGPLQKPTVNKIALKDNSTPNEAILAQKIVITDWRLNWSWSFTCILSRRFCCFASLLARAWRRAFSCLMSFSLSPASSASSSSSDAEKEDSASTMTSSACKTNPTHKCLKCSFQNLWPLSFHIYSFAFSFSVINKKRLLRVEKRLLGVEKAVATVKDSHLFLCERILSSPCVRHTVRWRSGHRDVFSSFEGQQRLFLSAQSLQKVLKHCDSFTICCYRLRKDDEHVFVNRTSRITCKTQRP